eukprot:9111357-Pyramimonas_sp.AAC.1
MATSTTPTPRRRQAGHSWWWRHSGERAERSRPFWLCFGVAALLSMVISAMTAWARRFLS